MRYLIIFFVILISCNSSKNKTVDSTQNELIETTDSFNVQIDEEITVKIVDSIYVDKVNYFVDSILSNRDNYTLITRYHVDGDCHGTDLLYYDKNNRLIIFIGSGGCSADESSFTSIYTSNGLLFYNLIEGGDGLVYNNSKIYYKDNNPLFGFQRKYEWDWETRSLTDSSSTILSKEKLVDNTKLKMSLDNNLGNVIDKVKNLKPTIRSDNKYKFTDTIQQVMEERYYLIDSVDYINCIK